MRDEIKRSSVPFREPSSILHSRSSILDLRLSFRLHPSSFPRVPLAVPYWSGATYRGILRSVLTGRVVTGPDLNQIQALVIETLGVEEAVLCGSGSLALEIALRACGVGQHDEVVIPTFCCTAVVPPVLAVGAVPVFADVGAEL
ncbi:MAG: DegT/DnrJ/EryC1/StrS family aminotransferase, partial [Deltaproteobacteria bacterium]|nr:DegT/DnrJ/EryC1/StrS family aminotransferase [Deltaproteobacteria bacterium]